MIVTLDIAMPRLPVEITKLPGRLAKMNDWKVQLININDSKLYI